MPEVLTSFVPAYRLFMEVLVVFLKDLSGHHDFAIRLSSDKYVFNVPRNLTVVSASRSSSKVPQHDV